MQGIVIDRGKDLLARTRLHCLHQMLTFVHFHAHYLHDGVFHTMRDRQRTGAYMTELEMLRKTCWALLMQADKRELTLCEQNALITLRKRVYEIIQDFHLSTDNYFKCLLTNDAYCMSLPSLFGSKSLDDSLIRPHISKVRSFSETNLMKPKRRASLCDT